MQRLIDASEILKSEHQHYDYMADEYYVLVRDIENAPTVDPVPVVVLCKDCKYYEEYKNGDYRCWKMILDPAKPTDFCSMGERREDAYEEPEINPCRGCEDYDGKGGCMSKGGCGERREDETD